MTVTAAIGSSPFWCLFDGVGKPLGGGFVYFGNANNPTVPKAVYSAIPISTQNAWPTQTLSGVQNVVAFNENGEQGPFIFTNNSTISNDNYYVAVYDTNGNLVYSMNNYFPGGGSGGGGGGTTVINAKNYIPNNMFWRNCGNIATPVPTSTIIAPGNHSAFLYPDMRFLKGNSTAVDQINFVPINPFGTPLLTNDVTPGFYLNYKSTVSGTAESFKYMQIPIQPNVEVLSNQSVTVSLWAQHVSGASTLTFTVRQYFGDGGSPSASVDTSQTYTFSNDSWTKIVFNISIPNVLGKTIGTCGTDGTYLLIQYPKDTTCEINITKPCLYLGSVTPPPEFESYDQTDAIIESPRTGDEVMTMQAARQGWVQSNNGYISLSNPSSVASVTRANVDTYYLYKLIWESTTNTECQLYNSAGTAIARGLSATADFVAVNLLALPKSVNNAVATAGPGHLLGSSAGSATQNLLIANMPNHNHPTGSIAKVQGTIQAVFASGGTAQSYNTFIGTTIAEVDVGAQGTGTLNDGTGSTPFSILPPTTYRNTFVKL